MLGLNSYHGIEPPSSLRCVLGFDIALDPDYWDSPSGRVLGQLGRDPVGVSLTLARVNGVQNWAKYV